VFLLVCKKTGSNCLFRNFWVHSPIAASSPPQDFSLANWRVDFICYCCCVRGTFKAPKEFGMIHGVVLIRVEACAFGTFL
jgi:hypothetical protein